MKRDTIIEVIAYVFIILFLYSGISKLSEYTVFKEQIAATPLFKNISSSVAWVLPIVEIIISVFLFLPITRTKALYGSLLLMTLFTMYIIYIINIDEKLPCSCGGIIELLSWKGHLVFNTCMIMLALIGIILSRKNFTSKSLKKSVLSYNNI